MESQELLLCRSHGLAMSGRSRLASTFRDVTTALCVCETRVTLRQVSRVCIPQRRLGTVYICMTTAAFTAAFSAPHPNLAVAVMSSRVPSLLRVLIRDDVKVGADASRLQSDPANLQNICPVQ